MAKALVILHGSIKSPPMSDAARGEAGRLLRRLQEGQTLGLPQSRPMRNIGKRVHELRINDEHETWRIVYRIDEDFIVIAHIFSKKSQKMPTAFIETCRRRYNDYDSS